MAKGPRNIDSEPTRPHVRLPETWEGEKGAPPPGWPAPPPQPAPSGWKSLRPYLIAALALHFFLSVPHVVEDPLPRILGDAVGAIDHEDDAERIVLPEDSQAREAEDDEEQGDGT